MSVICTNSIPYMVCFHMLPIVSGLHEHNAVGVHEHCTSGLHEHHVRGCTNLMLTMCMCMKMVIHGMPQRK
jgi:hypothetical protein